MQEKKLNKAVSDVKLMKTPEGKNQKSGMLLRQQQRKQKL